MILTMTLNPAVDISYHLDHFTYDHGHRVTNVYKTAGGKGINVARVLNQLDENVAATGFLGGALGDFIRSEIKALDINDSFVSINGDTRNCIAIIHDEGQQTELLENGPTIQAHEARAFMNQFQRMLQDVDLVTISGSLPHGLDASFYVSCLEVASKQKTPVILDTNGKLLQDVLKTDERPLLIKPNEHELADLFGKNMTEEADVIDALTSDILSRIPWVVVTRGGFGALVKHEDIIYRVSIPNIDVKNPVGSGDAVVAGFSSGLQRKLPNKELIAFGITMGVLNAMEEKIGHINPEKIDEIQAKVTVEIIK